ncbi:MAG TPA: hypothetical protein PKO15_15070 [Fibrobacteria bacterium]|nr:hypothetical protein [Fibrobacteria bacterium]HOX50468.1 hypothetical protein [Fibrobacteria bacterium]
MIRAWHILVFCLAGCVAACQGSKARQARLSERIDSISRKVEEIRGERFRSRVEGRVLARADLLRIYDSASMDESDPADSAWDRMIWTLGFIDSLGALDGVADSVDQASIEAFYTRGVLWVVDDMLDSSRLDLTIAHELAHALQDQRWDLRKLYRKHRGLDQRLSLQYLLEGEARLVETLYEHPSTDPREVLGYLPQLSMESFRDSLRAVGGLDPEFVTLPTYHTYEQGARALGLRRIRGGWKAVDEWFADPPPTWCFLHPDSACIAPVDPDPSPLFPSSKGWWLLREGRMGEHYLNILLSLWRESHLWFPDSAIKAREILAWSTREPDPDSISALWRGDRFQVLRDREGNLALAWRTIWKDSAAARAFQDAYLRVLVRKQRDDSLHTLTDRRVLFHDTQAGVWDQVERSGREVWISEGVPGLRPFQFPAHIDPNTLRTPRSGR